jgi:ubiquinone/menaquinone biosynthesis C-methylase UbiE
MNLEELLNLSYFQKSRILLSAIELDIFPTLSAPVSAEDLAAHFDYNVGATQRLLNALVAMGVLRLDDGRYRLDDGLSDALGEGPTSVIPMLKHRARLWRVWSSLTDVVKTGKTHYELHEPDFDHWEGLPAFTRAMAVGGRRMAGHTIEALDLDGVKSVLDIGGGPGIYAIEFCKALPDVRVRLLDQVGVQDVASEFIRDAGFQENISFYSGDALDVDVDDVVSSGQFDLVFMSNLIHAMSPGQIQELFRRCAGWAAPGGRIVVKDFFLDDTRTSPENAAIFSINMLVGTPDGNSYTWSETEEWLRAAGDVSGESRVKDVTRIVMKDGYSGIIEARLK